MWFSHKITLSHKVLSPFLINTIRAIFYRDIYIGNFFRFSRYHLLGRSVLRTDWNLAVFRLFAWIFSCPTQVSSRKNYGTVLHATGTNSAKKKGRLRSQFFLSISPRSLAKLFRKASIAFVPLRGTIPLTRDQLLDRGALLPCTPCRTKSARQIRYRS